MYVSLFTNKFNWFFGHHRTITSLHGRNVEFQIVSDMEYHFSVV